MRRTLQVLPAMMIVLIGIATATALLTTSSGSEIPFVTVRGEHALFQGSGVYRYDPAAVAREAVVWDAINLIIGLPLFLLALAFARKGRVRGRIGVAGFSFYFAYVYLMYATMSAFNSLFLVYVAIVGLSLVNLGFTLSGIDPHDVKSRVTSRFPRRLFGWFSVATAVILVLMWGRRILPILQTGQFPPEIAGMASLEVQAIDLGIVVPLMLVTGLLLFREEPWGYVLGGLTLTFGLMMDLTIPAWIVAELATRGVVRPFEAAPMFLVSIGGFALTWLYFRNLRENARGLVGA